MDIKTIYAVKSIQWLIEIFLIALYKDVYKNGIKIVKPKF